MKKILFIMLSLLAAKIDIQAQETWTRKADFPGAKRFGSFSFGIDKTIYVGGGSDASNTYSDVWAFNTSNNTWSQKAAIPIGRSLASSFTVFDKGYVVAGVGVSSLLQDVWEYSAAANTWNAKTMMPGLPRYGAAGFALGSKGYICCGNQGSANGPFANDLLEYNPLTDVWVTKASFPGAARYGMTNAAFILDNKAFVGLGARLSTQYEFYKDFYRFNPDSNSWMRIADYPGEASGYPVAFGICGFGYVGTGQANGQAATDLWRYDSHSNTWSKSSPFGGGDRWVMTSCVMGNKAYVGTGFDFNNYFNDWWEFTCGITTPVGEIDNNEMISLHPNPSSGKFDLVCKVPASYKITVKILTTTGQLVYNKDIAKAGPELIVSLDLSNLEKGTYLVEVISGEQTLLKKLVIN
jgi:N-acetylneuraminic acid mutarotase